MLLKALLLFIAVDCLWAVLDPTPRLAQLSLYNHVFPGRQRLPYGDRPDLAYNLSLFSLEAMFASHEIAAPKAEIEFRVVLIGDSATWGFLLRPEETLSAYLNAAQLHAPDGRWLRAYNLGYPTMSLTKDLLMLDLARRYQPDLIIWLVTLESFPRDKQLASSSLLQHNFQAVRALIERYNLRLDANDPQFVTATFWDATLVGQRRALADLLRLQLYGVMWAATGIDQYYPASYEPPQRDLDADETFHNLQPPRLNVEDLAFEVLDAGVNAAQGVPVLIVNEPIYLSDGRNSDIRYNFFYPRWAYDQYRDLLAGRCGMNEWRCLDVWDLVPPQEYTNSAVHLTPAGEALLAVEIVEALRTRFGIMP